MTKQTEFGFTPAIALYPLDGNRLAVAFDSQSPFDTTRTSAVVQIDSRFKRLAVELAGFTAETTNDSNSVRTIRGQLELVVERDGDTDGRHLLAECTLAIPGLSTGKKPTDVQFAEVPAVAYAIRQGVADALASAVTSYFSSQLSASAGPVVAPVASVPFGLPPVQSPRIKAANDESGMSRRKLVAVVAAGPVAIMLMWGLGKAFTPPSTVETAVADAMRADPAAVQAQVDLTRQTLVSMGLDPGKSGDIGCLTSPTP